MKPGDRVKMLDGVHRGCLMYVIREVSSGLWDVAPFPDGRGGVYVRPHQVEVIQPVTEVDYAELELRLVASMGIEPGEDIHQQTAERLGMTRAEAKVWNFKRLYGGGVGE